MDSRVEENTLKQRIEELKQREDLIREERQQLEAMLRNIVFTRYIDLLEHYQNRKPIQE